MTIALFCILLAAILPIACAGLAKGRAMKVSHKDGGYDNRNPREWIAKQTGASKWAQAAQENSWEALPFFAAAVIVSHMLGDWLVTQCAGRAVHRAAYRLRCAICDWKTAAALAGVDGGVCCECGDIFIAGVSAVSGAVGAAQAAKRRGAHHHRGSRRSYQRLANSAATAARETSSRRACCDARLHSGRPRILRECCRP
jgi:uncharacterized MAPEG superfamily protein